MKLAEPRWVVDGWYRRKVGNLVLDAADSIVWLDLPPWIWLPRLVRRTYRRMRDREVLWNGNRQTLRGAVWGRDSLFGHALSSYTRNRRELPTVLAGRRVVGLETPRAVEGWLDGAGHAVDLEVLREHHVQ